MKQVLLVIDAQRVYTQPDSELHCKDSKQTIHRINKLIKAYQKKKAPIIYIRHMHKNDGSDLGRMFDYLGEAEEEFGFKKGTEEVEYDDNLIRPKRINEIIKNRYSGFAGTRLNRKLKSLRARGVVIAGFMTNFCCESTARDAHDRDYFVDFVVDATGTPGTETLSEDTIRRMVSETMVSGIARSMSTKEFLKGFRK